MHSAALGSGTAALRCTQGNTVALLHLLNTACAAMMVGIDVSARWLHSVQVGTQGGRSCILATPISAVRFPLL